MFERIMVPVDLSQIDSLRHALDCAADLASHYDIPVTYVGVTASAPGSIAHSPEEFSQKLNAFTQGEVSTHRIVATSHTAVTNDPTTEVDDALLRAIDETGADLVVMASHVPGVLTNIWPTNGGKLAGHAKCSVLLVRN